MKSEMYSIVVGDSRGGKIYTVNQDAPIGGKVVVIEEDHSFKEFYNKMRIDVWVKKDEGEKFLWKSIINQPVEITYNHGS